MATHCSAGKTSFTSPIVMPASESPPSLLLEDQLKCHSPLPSLTVSWPQTMTRCQTSMLAHASESPPSSLLEDLLKCHSLLLPSLTTRYQTSTLAHASESPPSSLLEDLLAHH